MGKIFTAYLEGLPGQVLGAAAADDADTDDVIVWHADRERLERSAEDTLAFLEKQRDSAGVGTLTLHFPEGDTPALTHSKRVDILKLGYHKGLQTIVAELRERQSSAQATDRTRTITNGDIDEALEESFPASDPPAFNPGKA